MEPTWAATSPIQLKVADEQPRAEPPTDYPVVRWITLAGHRFKLTLWGPSKFYLLSDEEERRFEANAYRCLDCGGGDWLLSEPLSPESRCHDCKGKRLVARPMNDTEIRLTSNPRFFVLMLRDVEARLLVRQKLQKTERHRALTPGPARLMDHEEADPSVAPPPPEVKPAMLEERPKEPKGWKEYLKRYGFG